MEGDWRRERKLKDESCPRKKKEIKGFNLDYVHYNDFFLFLWTINLIKVEVSLRIIWKQG